MYQLSKKLTSTSVAMSLVALSILQTAPGEYVFNTADKELMEIFDGDLDVLLPNNDKWLKVIGGESFDVPANCAFTVKVNTPTDYCCSFIK